MTSKVILFEAAYDAALRIAREYSTSSGKEVVIVRDLRGRIRLALDTRIGTPEETALAERFANELGAYGYPASSAFLFRDEIGPLNGMLEAKLPVLDSPGVFVLDRQIIGHDWMRRRLMRSSTNLRFTFHGLKGGVGRSTAMACWSWRLAEQGMKVLVLDLDLESPGLSSTLLPESSRPDFGIVDWFVEDGVSQGDGILGEMVARSPLASRAPGQILVAPALGAKTGEYLAKLSRCYSDFSAEGADSWAERLNRLVESLEQEHRPDVVFFDSRAGLHDVAGVLITRMDADCFLFAVDSRQTWDGYGALFQQWNRVPDLGKAIRERIQMVAGLVPDTGVDTYLKSFQEHSWDLFRESLYDEVAADDLDAFSFDLEDRDAPHSPLRILWHRALMEFDPVANEANLRSAVDVAYSDFFLRAERFLARSSGEKP